MIGVRFGSMDWMSAKNKALANYSVIQEELAKALARQTKNAPGQSAFDALSVAETQRLANLTQATGLRFNYQV